MGRPEEEVTAVGRAEILDTAKQYVTKDRQSTHGKPEDSFGRISEYWSAHLKREVTRHAGATTPPLFTRESIGLSRWL